LWLFLKCQNALWSFFPPLERFRSFESNIYIMKGKYCCFPIGNILSG
jgi:hypothetical protein